MMELLEDVIARYSIVYRYRRVPLLSKEIASTLLSLDDGKCVEASQDLGFSRVVACREGDEVILGRTRVSMSVLEEIAERGKDDAVYALIDGEPIEVSMYSSEWGFHKLKYLGFGVPTTLEINGIHMHRILGIDPYRDAELKVRSLGRVKGLVLDTCMGLGYTAIKALERGASKVITVEISPLVIEIAKLNPWSSPLENPVVEVLHADVVKVVHELPSECLDAIIHDPPRISVAGELYSLEMYRELYRVLKPGAKIFHYTGEPGKHGGPRYLKGIKERLQRAGFVNIEWIDKALGFIARKPH